MELDALLIRWVGISLACLGSFGLGWLLARRWETRASAREASLVELGSRLAQLNSQVAADPSLAALLVRYIESPDSLTRLEGIRARAWFDSARRLHRLLLEFPELSASERDALLPSMGEPAAKSGGASRRHHAAPITLLDPEFFAVVAAIRDREPEAIAREAELGR